MQHHSQIEIRAARLYVSPRTRALTPDEAETRRIAYAIKSLDCPTGMLETAAKEIAAMLWQPCNLIPVPSHTGDTRANLRLCKLIAAKTQGAQVRDILTRTAPIESQCQRHRAAQGRTPPEHHTRGAFLQPTDHNRNAALHPTAPWTGFSMAWKSQAGRLSWLWES